MYVAILRNCQAHVISATLAHYIVTHGSRFRFSHQFAYIPISQYERYFQNETILTPIRHINNKFEFGSRIINYIKRPLATETSCNLHYFIFYKNAKLTMELKRNLEYYPYIESHPSQDSQCVVDRLDSGNFIPEIPFCLLPDLAKVGSIFDINSGQMSMAHNVIRERYAMFVCLLLFPFRSMDDIQYGKNHRRSILILLLYYIYDRFSTYALNFIHVYRGLVY
jgi:hypothetical protein